MDDKLNQLKEKQAEIGDKISLLQETNKRKDEEAAEIRQLIQECRENLSRIKGMSSTCTESKMGMGNNGVEESFEDEQNTKGDNGEERRSGRRALGEEQGSGRRASGEEQGSGRRAYEEEQGSGKRASGEEQGSGKRASGEEQGSGRRPCGEGKKGRICGDNPGDGKRPCGPPKSPCDEILANKAEEAKKKKKNKERVSCKVDLNRMKVRVRGPSEDLKKLDATQLINLLEKFECQELIINTGDELMKDPGEIRLIYLLHPGNIIMVAGIIMIAFLINTNICHVGCNSSIRLLLNMLYVGSFAFHYGMVLWMIFVRGYALKFGLNQDSFHLIDNIILPKYFSVCVLLSVLSLYSFLATHCVSPCSSWPLEVIAQIAIVVITFFMELTTICYLVPALIKLRDITDDYVFDEDEPDCAVPQSYEINLVKLRKLNWTLSLINFLTLLLLGANIYYITSKLNTGIAR